MPAKRSKVPMKMRPIYVEYVAMRKCRNNPSYDQFAELPKLRKDFLWGRWETNRKRKNREV